MVLRTFWIVLLAAIGGTPCLAEDDATEIVRAAIAHWRGDTSYSKFTMIIHRPDWERNISMLAWTQGDDRSLVRVTAPARDRGTGTLMRDNNMWSFAPKINRVIKIPSSMMGQSWMGSDFTNDDLVKENTLAEDYHAKLEEHPSDPNQFYFIVLRPKNETVTVWGKISISIRRQDFMPVEQIYYNEDGEKKRVMEFSGIQQMGGKMIPAVMEMRTLNKNSRTLIRYKSFDFKPVFSKTIFSFSQLRRK